MKVAKCFYVYLYSSSYLIVLISRLNKMLEAEYLSPDNVWNLVLFFFREQFAFNIFVAG